MKVALIALFVLIIGTVFSVSSYCDYQYENEEMRVFDGKVTNVSGSSLTVSGSTGTITFPISPDTKLIKDVYDISLSDIGVGNYVTVEYYRNTKGLSRVPSRVTKVTVEYGSEGW